MNSPSQPAEKALSCPLCKVEPVRSYRVKDIPPYLWCGSSPSCKMFGIRHTEEAWLALPRYTAEDLQKAREQGCREGLLAAMSLPYISAIDIGLLSAESICRAALPKEEGKC